MAGRGGGPTRESLRDGFLALTRRTLALDGEWGSPIPGYDGWSCKDLLAHISSTAASLPAIAASAVAPAAAGAPSASTEPFDSDRWNASQVRRRADKDAKELMLELESGTERLGAELAQLPLEQPIRIGTYAGLPMGEAMQRMLEHQSHHISDLENALAG